MAQKSHLNLKCVTFGYFGAKPPDISNNTDKSFVFYFKASNIGRKFTMKYCIRRSDQSESLYSDKEDG